MNRAMLLVLLGFAVCCGAGGANPQSADKISGHSETGVSISLKVVDNIGARGLDPRKALEVTLRNGLQAETIWVEGRMSPSPGVIDVDLRDESGRRVDENCHRNPAPSEAADYVMLGPGDAITRLLILTCYKLPQSGRITAHVRYKNVESSPPPAPLELVPLFRGPINSNPVTFSP